MASLCDCEAILETVLGLTHEANPRIIYSQSRKKLVWLSRNHSWLTGLRYAQPFRKEWLSRSHQWSHPQNRKFSWYDLVTFRRHQRQPFHPTANSTFQVTRILEKFFCWCVIPWWISHPKHRRKVVACHKWNHRVMLVFINTRGEKYLFNCLETYISSLFLLALLCTAKSGFIPQSQSTT